MKIGLYGGTFDPPHNAHLALAEWVQKELQLEYIYFIPTAIHAFKNNSDLSPPPIRLKLVKKAIAGYNKFRVSRIELDRPETSYTVHTLKKFRHFENLPECELHYIMGSDNLADFHRWKDPQLIMKLAKIVVIRRSVNEFRVVNPDIIQKVIFLDSPIIDLSATEIRNKIKLGIDCSDQIPITVLKLIHEYGLYGSQKKK